MKILLLGGNGLIGRAVFELFKSEPEDHEILIASRESEYSVDMMSSDSIRVMYDRIGQVDAIISTAGNLTFKYFDEMDRLDLEHGLNHKLMGQVELVRIGMDYLVNSGSFTLISGILNHYPIKMGVSASMVNAALEGFVKAVSLEQRSEFRINLVSPTVLSEAMHVYGNYFPGYLPVNVSDVAQAFKRSVLSMDTGVVYHVGY